MTSPSGPRPPLPTFLVIGAQKSATRWLRLNLGRHPDVFTAARELEFFDNHFDDGVDAYRRAFKGWSGETIVGEATPGYMMWRKDPARISARIQQTIPDVRLLAILRNPVERAYSAFLHHIVRGRLDPRADLIETVLRTPPEQDPLSLISGGWYARSLEPYVRRFGDALLVLFQDCAKADASAVYRRALEHIGADPDFVPPRLTSVRFSSDAQLPPETGHLAGEGRRRELTLEERMFLYDYFRAEIVQLEDLLHVDLARWKLDRAA